MLVGAGINNKESDLISRVFATFGSFLFGGIGKRQLASAAYQIAFLFLKQESGLIAQVALYTANHSEWLSDG